VKLVVRLSTFPLNVHSSPIIYPFLRWAFYGEHFALLSFEAYSSSSIVKDFASFSTVGISFSVLFDCFEGIMWRLTVGQRYVRYTVHAVPSLYIGGQSQITIILWPWSGGRGAYRVSHGRSPFLSLPIPSTNATNHCIFIGNFRYRGTT
jgi:hypothetical protein